MSDQAPDAGSPSPDVARLAAEVERLGRRLDSLAKRFEERLNSGDSDTGAFEELRSQVEAVARQLDSETQVPSGPSPISWLDLNAEQAPVALRELGEWIGSVLVQYDLDRIVPCWFRHSDVVQVLLDLRTAWLVAYRNPDGGKVSGALDWHQRYLPAARQYLKGLKCTGREHFPRGTAFTVDADAMQAYAVWWGSGRPSEG